MHFLMSCSKYDKTRQDLFSIVGMTCINFQNLSIEEIFLWLMTCENDLVLKEMCQFICKYCRWFFFLSDISIASCSSALDTRRSVRFTMLHFLEYHPLVSLCRMTTCSSYLFWSIHSILKLHVNNILYICTGHEEECKH